MLLELSLWELLEQFLVDQFKSCELLKLILHLVVKLGEG